MVLTKGTARDLGATARGNQNGTVVAVVASDKVPPNSHGLAFVYSEGTCRMPAPLWLLAHSKLSNLCDWGALAALHSSAVTVGECSVLQHAAQSGNSTDQSSLCSSSLASDQKLGFRILLKPVVKALFYWLINRHAAAAAGLATPLWVLHMASMDEVRVSRATLWECRKASSYWLCTITWILPQFSWSNPLYKWIY